MQNDKKQVVDLYIPRRCFATNRLLSAKDYASVQITLAKPEMKEEQKKEDQKREGSNNITMILSGFVRSKGNSDAALNKYLKSKGLLSFC